mgnify:CR=1 FL=1|tara:strand:- start:1 stop:1383 length:1383 start_codon:yes stop_codon:yes gene_type:complete
MAESGSLAWYIDAIKDIDFAYAWVGMGIIHAFLSILTLIFLFTLATMILRARPDSAENRFMSLMLYVEGLKTIVTWYAIYPFGPEILPVMQYWRVVYYTMCLLSIMMYLSLSSFYPVKFLKFMTKDSIKNNLYWALPAISVVLMALIITSSGGIYETFNGSLYVECPEGGGEGAAVIESSYGDDGLTGNCIEEHTPYHFVTVEQSDLGRLLLMSPVLTAFIALAFMRSAQKSLQVDEGDDEAVQRSTEARAIAVGFTGKTFFQGTMLFSMIYISAVYGKFNSSDLLNVELNDSFKYYFFGLYGFLFSALFAGLFEGTMFTYAILKNDVLGIDEKLRRTFSTAIFATLGAIAFLVASEIVESLVGGSGWIGGVLIGAPLIVLRKPIYSVINGFSSRLMPESFTAAERTYLEAYELAMEDLIVTEEERKFLQLQAKTLGLDENRITHLESWYDESLVSDEEE